MLESYITEEPYNVAGYTSECFQHMMAAEAAMYAIESKCCVECLNTTDEDKLQELDQTMEASLRGAWETIKDWASRAWEALKKFIKKVWNKLKGYASMVRNYFKKFSQSLHDDRGNNAMVLWSDIKPEEALKTANEWTDEKKLLKLDDQTWQQFRDDLYKRVWDGSFDYEPKRAKFGSIRKDAIKVADMGHDKYLQGFLKLGETKEKEFYAGYKKAMRDIDKMVEDSDDDDDGAKEAANDVKKIFRRGIKVIQECVATYNKAANKMYSQSVKACRVALRYAAGDHSAGEKGDENYSTRSKYIPGSSNYSSSFSSSSSSSSTVTPPPMGSTYRHVRNGQSPENRTAHGSRGIQTRKARRLMGEEFIPFINMLDSIMY